MNSYRKYFYLLSLVLAFNARPAFGSEQSLVCEKQLRFKMDQNKIQLLPEPRLKTQIDKVNALILMPGEQSIAFTELNNQIIEFTSLKTLNTSKSHDELSMTIGLNEKTSEWPMYFEIKNIIIKSNLKQELIQRYSMNENCNLNLKQTSLTELKRNLKNEIIYSTVEISADGEVLEDKVNTYIIPDGKTLIDLMPISDPFQTKKNLAGLKNPVVFLPTSGFVDVQFGFQAKTHESAFGLHFNFDQYSMSLKINNTNFISGSIAVDEVSKVSYSFIKSQNKKYWYVPSRLKNQIFLGQPQLGDSYFDSRLSSADQINDSYILKNNKKLSYDHLGAYYKVENLGLENEFNIYKMKEVFPPVISGEISPLDLESNSTIQTELPEIQKIAGDILKKASNRRDQIAEILKYLSLNYKYDYEMVEKDKVRPLTTRQALDRKKGVCQHYAVLFTAIARALKIPSRIVQGYFIDGNKAGRHAWVEAETSEKLWQVIEPQFATGLLSTRTRFYFPLSRAHELEDMNTKVTEEDVKKLYNLKSIALPLQ